MDPGGLHQQVFEEELDEDYEPTAEEIDEYAKWLGLDPATDSDLLWIAREGLKAPLPDEWKPCRSPLGDLYYFNFTSGRSSWEHPSDIYYKNLFLEEKRKRCQPTRPAPAPQQQLWAGSSPLRPASRPLTAAPTGPGVTASSSPAFSPMAGTRPSTAHGHPTWGAAPGLAQRQLHTAPGGAGGLARWGQGGAGNSAAASPKRTSGPLERSSTIGGAGGAGIGIGAAVCQAPFPGGRKPATAPAGGPKKVTWQDLVSIDPQPTAMLPPKSTPNPAAPPPGGAPYVGQQHGLGTPAAPCGSGNCRPGGSNSYAQQMQVYRAKMAAVAAAGPAAAATSAVVDAAAKEEAKGGAGHAEQGDRAGMDACVRACKGATPAAAEEQKGTRGQGDEAMPAQRADAMDAAQPSPATSPADAAGMRARGGGFASEAQPSNGCSYSSDFEREDHSGDAFPGCKGRASQNQIGPEAPNPLHNGHRCPREPLTGAAHRAAQPQEQLGGGRISGEGEREVAGHEVLSRQHRDSGQGQAKGEVPQKLAGEEGQGAGAQTPQPPQDTDQAFGGSGPPSSEATSSRAPPGAARTAAVGSAPAPSGEPAAAHVPKQRSQAPERSVPGRADMEHCSRSDGEGGACTRDPCASLEQRGAAGPGAGVAGCAAEASGEQSRAAFASQPGQLASNANSCADSEQHEGRQQQQGGSAQQPESSGSEAGGRYGKQQACLVHCGCQLGATPLPMHAAEQRGELGSPEACCLDGAAPEHQQQQARADGELERRLAAQAAAALAKARTETLREQARRQREEAVQAKLRLQLKLDARHLASMAASLQGMKENLAATSRLGQQGEQVVHAVLLPVLATCCAFTRSSSSLESTGMIREQPTPAGQPGLGGFMQQAAPVKEEDAALDGKIGRCLEKLQHALLDFAGACV